MKLVSFSVENVRSITNARKIPLSAYSLLVGANNEGKSNILHALALAINALVGWQRQIRRTADGRIVRSAPRMVHSRYQRLRYDWTTDYPVRLQNSAPNDAATNIILEFTLSEQEVSEFKEEVKSNLNGTLPLQVSFTQREIEVSVKKPGRGQATLTRKRNRIADFVSRRIRFEYIPAIRTSESAMRVISQLVERELYLLEDNDEYAIALSKIEELQKTILEGLAGTIQSTVADFLPSVKSVMLRIRQEDRYRSLRRDVEIVVDDGQKTILERKGDGVQSLVALALMRHASEQNSPSISNIIAIEEPESHLHPKAVHELKDVLEALATRNQVVLTSHSPLFVSPTSLDNTVIVKGSKAAPARRISEIREALGVRFSDNLQNARVVLLVEGRDDMLALKSIISTRSEKLKAAIRDNTVAFDDLGGAGGLRQKAALYLSGACLVQCFIGDDGAGRAAVDRAVADKVTKNGRCQS